MVFAEKRYKKRVERETKRILLDLEARNLPYGTAIPIPEVINGVKISVMSMGKAERCCLYPDPGDRTAIVSINNAWMFEPASLRLTESGNDGVYVFQKWFFDDEEIGGQNVIRPKDAEEIARFIAEDVFSRPGAINRLIIHCEVGRSRSAAIAAATVRWLGEDDMGFFTSERYHPNLTVYSRMLDAFAKIAPPPRS